MPSLKNKDDKKRQVSKYVKTLLLRIKCCQFYEMVVFCCWKNTSQIILPGRKKVFLIFSDTMIPPKQFRLYRTLSPGIFQDMRNPRLPSCCLECISFAWFVHQIHANSSKSPRRPILPILREGGDQESSQRMELKNKKIVFPT